MVRFTPLFVEAARPCRHTPGDRWFVDETYVKVRGRWRYLYRAVDQFGQVIDVLLSPTSAQPPPRHGVIDQNAPGIDGITWTRQTFERFPFTPLFNATGQPAISLPLHWSNDALPMGSQFVGRFGDEATLLQLASQIEQAAPWSERRPPLLG